MIVGSKNQPLPVDGSTVALPPAAIGDAAVSRGVQIGRYFRQMLGRIDCAEIHALRETVPDAQATGALRSVSR